MKKIVSQFIPIILVFLLLTQSKRLAIFSNSVLGKLIAVSLIIFYTNIDKILGLFVCALVILYYQLDYVEAYLNMSTENFASINQTFRSENCKNGILKYKNMDVRNEMADHVFQELKFKDDDKCNVCSDTCSFSIIESKMSKELELQPINTKA
jgi:hypothetical protein